MSNKYPNTIAYRYKYKFTDLKQCQGDLDLTSYLDFVYQHAGKCKARSR